MGIGGFINGIAAPPPRKAALVQFSAPFLEPATNVIVFQYNPESLTRTIAPYDPAPTQPMPVPERAAGTEQAASSVPDDQQPFHPVETISLNLILDASDALEFPELNPEAVRSGVADRLAALEMLLYPALEGTETQLAGSAADSVGGGGSSGGGKAPGLTAAVPQRRRVPTVLFVWGPGRIVPVRVTTFTVEEVQYNHLLYPHRAKVALGLRVITSETIASINPQRREHELAASAYDQTFKLKQRLAQDSSDRAIDARMGLSPF